MFGKSPFSIFIDNAFDLKNQQLLHCVFRNAFRFFAMMAGFVEAKQRRSLSARHDHT